MRRPPQFVFGLHFRPRAPLVCPETRTVRVCGLHVVGAIFWAAILLTYLGLVLAVMP